MKFQRPTTLIAIGAACALTTGALGQATKQDKSAKHQADRGRSVQQLQGQGQDQEQRQGQDAASIVLDEEAAAVIGYDVDLDGTTDYVYYISAMDLERIQHNGHRTTGMRDATRDNRFRQARQHQHQHQHQHPQQQQARRAGTHTFRGTIEDYRKINLDGHREANTFVRLRTQDGRSVVVDLGPGTDLPDLNLQRGDRVVVQGNRTTINHRPVLRADRLRLDGDVMRVGDRGMRQMQQMRPSVPTRQGPQRVGQPSTKRIYSVHGRIEDARPVTLDGQRDPHTVIRLRLQDGRTRHLNLGPNVSLSDLNLQQGDVVDARGHIGRINDTPVMMVNRIRVSDVYRMNRR